MDVRERLLHNEIQNLGQMVQIVSYELTLLSDFMKEKFGSSFDSFRERHSQQSDVPQSFSEHEKASPKKISLTARKSTAPLQRKKDGPGYSSSEPKRFRADNGENDDGCQNDNNVEIETNWESDVGDAEDCELADNSSMIDIDDPYAPGSGDEDDDSYSTVTVGENDIPKGAKLIRFTKPDPDEKAIGRARSNIWNKYIVSKLPNGSLHAKCPRCRNPVSSKVERLKNHYRKCVLGQLQLKGKTPKYNKSQADICIEEEDKRKVAELIRTMNVRREHNDDDSQTVNPSPATQSESTSGEKEGAASDVARGGRKADPVWDYFKILEDPETKKRVVKCKRCDVTVSSKVERARRHFVICHELDKEGD